MTFQPMKCLEVAFCLWKTDHMRNLKKEKIEFKRVNIVNKTKNYEA